MYLQDNDTEKSYWLTYDGILDDWNKTYFKDTIAKKDLITFGSKYNTSFSKVAIADTINLPKSTFTISIDTTINNNRLIKLCVLPNRQLNSIEINSNTKKKFKQFSINGTEVSTKIDSKFFNDESPRIATYSVVDNEPLELSFSIEDDTEPHIELFEISHDILQNEQLNVSKRQENMIPKPFVINDAIITKNTIEFND